MDGPGVAVGPGEDHFMQIGTGFMSSKALLLAIKLGLFTALSKFPEGLTWEQLGRELGLKVDGGFRGTRDLFDLLVALQCLNRTGDGPDATYTNTPGGAKFLVEGSPVSLCGVLTMLNDRLFRFWANLEDGLRTGEIQNEAKTGGDDLFTMLQRDQKVLEGFHHAMTGFSRGRFMMLAQSFDFGRYKTLADFGGSLATLSICVAEAHPHITATSYDLPDIKDLTDRVIADRGLSDRVKAGVCNFFKEEDLPGADVITMGMILHDWNLDTKKVLMRKAFNALPAGGAFIAIEYIIDDERRTSVPGLCMSLNMVIETGRMNGFDYSFREFSEWAREVGFSSCQSVPLGASGACVAFK